jgi:phospholipid N-methyltransferase
MTRMESEYYSYLDYGGERATAALAHYVQFFQAGPVLELGCGQGEFLTLLQNAGLACSGVDIDPGMVEKCRADGHEVVLADAGAHLRSLPDAELGGVFAAHFLEHLTTQDAALLIEQVGRVLAPGGTFVAVVPNPGSLSVLSYDFWRDPTHVRFYDPQLIGFLASRAGMTVVDGGGNPENNPGPPPPTQLIDYAPRPSIGDEISRLIHLTYHLRGLAEQQQQQRLAQQQADKAGRRGRRTRNIPPDEENNDSTELPDPWPWAGHLLSVLDQQLQEVQHQVAALRAAYQNLLTHLYPPSEVYVVARVPEHRPTGELTEGLPT